MLTFDEPTHTYYHDGKKIPSVTTILSAQGAGVDYGSIPPDVLQKAAERGTEVHRVAEHYYLHGSPIETTLKSAQAYMDGLRNFVASDVFRCLATERRLACPKYWFAGTVDLIGWVNGQFSVVDIKTTSKLHTETVEYQLALYQYLVEQDMGEPVVGRYALHLDKSASGYKLVDVNMDPAARAKALRMVYEYNKENMRRS
jgi:hypothetical protein